MVGNRSACVFFFLLVAKEAIASFLV